MPELRVIKLLRSGEETEIVDDNAIATHEKILSSLKERIDVYNKTRLHSPQMPAIVLQGRRKDHMRFDFDPGSQSEVGIADRLRTLFRRAGKKSVMLACGQSLWLFALWNPALFPELFGTREGQEPRRPTSAGRFESTLSVLIEHDNLDIPLPLRNNGSSANSHTADTIFEVVRLRIQKKVR